MGKPKRATVYFDPSLHRALRVKAVQTEQSVSELVNAAVRLSLVEDADDLAAFEARAKEPDLDFEEVLKDLLQIKPSASKELEAIPLKDRKRLVTKIRGLAKEPRPPGCEKLSGQEKFRLRRGHYRVLYSVDDAESVVVIVKVGHRRDVYR